LKIKNNHLKKMFFERRGFIEINSNKTKSIGLLYLEI